VSGGNTAGSMGSIFFTPLVDMNYTLDFDSNVPDYDRGRSKSYIFKNSKDPSLPVSVPPKGLPPTGPIVETGLLTAGTQYDLEYEFGVDQPGDPTSGSATMSLDLEPTPEPGTLALLAAGGLFLVVGARRMGLRARPKKET